MFNRHFYAAKPKEPRNILKEFFSGSEQEALILDPPFGGHVDPLAATVRYFSKLYSKMNSQKELKGVPICFVEFYMIALSLRLDVLERCLMGIKVSDFIGATGGIK